MNEAPNYGHLLRGKASLDMESYGALQRRIGILEGIACGERAADEGRTLTHAQAKRRLARWLN